MNEYRAKTIEKIGKKVAGMIDVVDILIDGELQHLNEYDAAEQVCQHMTDACNNLRRAVFYLAQASAAAEMEDMQDQTKMDLQRMSQ